MVITECKNCGSKKLVGCNGGTNIEPVEGIEYICQDCSYEGGEIQDKYWSLVQNGLTYLAEFNISEDLETMKPLDSIKIIIQRLKDNAQQLNYYAEILQTGINNVEK